NVSALFSLNWFVPTVFDQGFNHKVEGIVIVIVYNEALRCLHQLIEFFLKLNFQVQIKKWVQLHYCKITDEDNYFTYLSRILIDERDILNGGQQNWLTI
ncbi:MAG: hypothetical protein RL266_1753, partial [Bacteroidota bacterium]